ncbi:magnesium transporter CorA family protein [Bacillus testis]|uniref:hypothetical protein n=1 Tax=Bacillus testis TaxID=1622072 RepID=UPI00067F1D67|nr:hypothetical protein [Bacillus testis]
MDEEQGIVAQSSHFQFMFPFMLKRKSSDQVVEDLLADGFEFFNLKNNEQEAKFYNGHTVSHRSLEKFFLPNIERILFPKDYKVTESLRRFSKRVDLECKLESKKLQAHFTIPSVDIIICPFQIGIMNIRVELDEGLSLTDVLEFSAEFRVMEPIVDNDPSRLISCDKHRFHEVKDFIFHSLFSTIQEYVDKGEDNAPYFGSLPFFTDERMFVTGYLNMEGTTEITKTDLFRIGHLFGYDSDEQPFVGANNPAYVERYYDSNVYDRWAEETYFVISDYTFSCVTKSNEESVNRELANAMYGKHFYSILLYYYYKIVLMKLSYEQSEIEINKDRNKIEKLIMKITEFSAKYYFPEVNSSTTGKEIFQIVKNVYQIDYLYNHLNNTLETLYQNHERLVSTRHNYLLQILTVYTVISGIYGMNLVIEDWKGSVKWYKVADYSFFEWVNLVVALSGITISSVLGIYFLFNWIRGFFRKED